ncbi:serine hydrolase domain-containing protein [Massilia pseudoviolaceinigra]|uniref:serine hydrolase domain-containing protein n=1 Tax=Massilia pseudoviolaceinigra TaxID=3057165 RepID=UPI0027966D44|nr:serine hydrolase domain-containing protein [Massilia sp. CCM 9206]MDQ1920502.1 serine hydrolase domain-containing protein [Massilia sp. CCM 9206]
MEKLRQYFLELESTLPADGPGFSAVVLQENAVVCELHHGLASLELEVPLSGKSAYYLASESKQFTAACVLALVRAGRIGLDDDVCLHLPELARMEQAFPLRSLLNHTSGIPDYFQFLACQLGRHEADYFNNALILKMIACFDTVAFPTGTAYGYSNSNYILLAALIERLSGLSTARFARETLFAPLGIKRMGFDDDRGNVLAHRVFSYEADAARPRGYKQHLGNANTVGDGGMYASTDELVLWEREWHRQWADSGSMLHAMLQPSPMADGTVLPYRFGLELIERNSTDFVFHSGGLWGFDTLLLRVPARRLSVICLANCGSAEPDMERMLAAVA